MRATRGMSRRLSVRGMGWVITTAVRYNPEGDPRVARLQEELACRDEVIVALQHVIRDLHHELENLRAEYRYAAFALEAASSEDGESSPAPGDIASDGITLPLADALSG